MSTAVIPQNAQPRSLLLRACSAVFGGYQFAVGLHLLIIVISIASIAVTNKAACGKSENVETEAEGQVDRGAGGCSIVHSGPLAS